MTRLNLVQLSSPTCVDCGVAHVPWSSTLPACWWRGCSVKRLQSPCPNSTTAPPTWTKTSRWKTPNKKQWRCHIPKVLIIKEHLIARERVININHVIWHSYDIYIYIYKSTTQQSSYFITNLQSTTIKFTDVMPERFRKGKQCPISIDI